MRTLGKMSVSAPGPVPPTIISLVRKSSSVWIGDSCQATQTLTSLLALPSQVNLEASNFAFLLPNRGSMGMPRPKVAMAVPSLGRVL